MSPHRVERFFDVTVDNFRALMKRLQIQHPQGWPASTGERLYWREKEPWDDIPLGVRIVHPNGIIDKTLPTEKSWHVWRAGDVVGHQRPSARIYAFEERTNLLVVIFQDGALVRDEPTEKIDLAFEEFEQMIIKELKAEPKQSGFCPKSVAGKRRYRRAYPVLRETRRALSHEDIRPKHEDYLEALRGAGITEFYNASQRTIDRILKCGDNDEFD